jgi:4-diphosphocytidyl-2-C-methyl-D-erythritol kinase
MCTVALFDTLDVRPQAHPQQQQDEAGSSAGDVGDRGIVTMTCDDPRLPCDESNLVVKAGRLVAGAIAERRRPEQTGRHTPAREGGVSSAVAETSANAMTTATTGAASGAVAPQPRGLDAEFAREMPALVAAAAVALTKRVPFGAGLGGGSSDAASAMLALNRLWRGGLDATALATLAARVGSDVPFFFYGPSAVCTGRGEVVRPIAAPRVARWALLVLPNIAMPTPAVYRRFDEMKLGDSVDLRDEPDWAAWADLESNKLLPLLVNDLEAPSFALRPELGELRREIEVRLGRPVRMSGSGSSLFTLFDQANEAEVAARQVGRQLGVRALAVELAPALNGGRRA